MPRLNPGRSPFPQAKEDPSTVLVVEDEELVRLVICDYLQDCGFNVFGAATVAEAIDILQSAKARIDLVFSDVRLSGELDGIDLAHWVRQNRGDLPIILTSGYTARSAAATELCRAHNMPFFAKPYDMVRVGAAIRELVGASRP